MKIEYVTTNTIFSIYIQDLYPKHEEKDNPFCHIPPLDQYNTLPHNHFL